MLTAATRALLLLLLIAACSGQLAGRTFETTLVDQGGEYALPVRLGDTTDKVLRIEQGTLEPGRVSGTGVWAVAGNPNSFVVTWLGGVCDGDAVINLWPLDEGYGLQIHTNGKPGLGCPAAAVPRSLLVTLSEPVAAESIAIVGGA